MFQCNGRKLWPLIDDICCTRFLILCEQLCFGATNVWDFPSLLLLICLYWNRGLMCRSFMTCSDNKFCHRRVGLCNLKNILHCVVTLCFAVSCLFTVHSHKFLIIAVLAVKLNLSLSTPSILSAVTESRIIMSALNGNEWSNSRTRHFTHK